MMKYHYCFLAENSLEVKFVKLFLMKLVGKILGDLFCHTIILKICKLQNFQKFYDECDDRTESFLIAFRFTNCSLAVFFNIFKL